MLDQIILNGIRVMAHVGVPDRERAKPQALEISAVLHLDLKPACRTDRLEYTIDYAEVHRKIIGLAKQRPRRLIETMAEDMAKAIIKTFKVKRVEIEIHKFILEHTRSVAVRIVREAPAKRRRRNKHSK